MNTQSPVISQYIKDLCNEACALAESGDLFAAAGIEAVLKLSNEFGAPHAAKIVELKILLVAKTMPVAGAVQ